MVPAMSSEVCHRETVCSGPAHLVARMCTALRAGADDGHPMWTWAISQVTTSLRSREVLLSTGDSVTYINRLPESFKRLDIPQQPSVPSVQPRKAVRVPPPDAITQQVLDAAKRDRISAIKAAEEIMTADAAKVKAVHDAISSLSASSKDASKQALKAEVAADQAQKKLSRLRAHILCVKQSPHKDDQTLKLHLQSGNSTGVSLTTLHGLEEQCKQQEAAVKAAVQAASELAKKAHDSLVSLDNELACLEKARETAARSRSAWVSENFMASISTGDESFASEAAASEDTLHASIDALCQSAPSMDSIVAFRMELEQGNFPKPPEWLEGADAMLGYNPLGEVNPYTGDFDASAFYMPPDTKSTTVDKVVMEQVDTADIGSDRWMQEQDRMLQTMVSKALSSSRATSVR